MSLHKEAVSAEEMQGCVSDRKSLLQQLEAQACALEAENKTLRGQVANLPVGSSELMTNENHASVSRLRSQCDALRKVLRQREDEVSKERHRASELRTAIRAAQIEYARNMARSSQEVGHLQQNQSRREERIRLLQQHVEEARRQGETDSKTISILRSRVEALKIDRQLAHKRSVLTDPRDAPHIPPKKELPSSSCSENELSRCTICVQLSTQHCSASDTDDQLVISPLSPHGPGCEQLPTPAQVLNLLALLAQKYKY
jgi:chromosome segregation ATPase